MKAAWLRAALAAILVLVALTGSAQGFTICLAATRSKPATAASCNDLRRAMQSLSGYNAAAWRAAACRDQPLPGMAPGPPSPSPLYYLCLDTPRFPTYSSQVSTTWSMTRLRGGAFMSTFSSSYRNPSVRPAIWVSYSNINGNGLPAGLNAAFRGQRWAVAYNRVNIVRSPPPLAAAPPALPPPFDQPPEPPAPPAPPPSPPSPPSPPPSPPDPPTLPNFPFEPETPFAPLLPPPSPPVAPSPPQPTGFSPNQMPPSPVPPLNNVQPPSPASPIYPLSPGAVLSPSTPPPPPDVSPNQLPPSPPPSTSSQPFSPSSPIYPLPPGMVLPPFSPPPPLSDLSPYQMPPSPPPPSNNQPSSPSMTDGFPWSACNSHIAPWGTLTFIGLGAAEQAHYVAWRFTLTPLATATFDLYKLAFPIQVSARVVGNNIRFNGIKVSPSYTQYGPGRLMFRISSFPVYAPSRGAVEVSFEVPAAMSINQFFLLGVDGMPVWAAYNANLRMCPVGTIF